MPHHQDNSLTHMVARVRRWGADRRTARRADWRVPAEVPVDASGHRSTLEATIRPVGGGRYRRLGWAPGEPHEVRDDLIGRPAGAVASARRSILYFAQHTDTHVCDAQSPARLEGGETFGWFNPGADGGHRPQETCTTQVLDRLVAATNAARVSPVTGAPMAWCAQTGDNTDNRTEAEVAWWMGVLNGERITPNTGAEGRYEGVQRSGWRGAWHPDDPSRDLYGRTGFPRLPGFLDAAVAPFDAEGLEVPWLAVFGNHDVIYQGTFGPRVARLGDLLASSSHKPIGAFGLVRSNVHAKVLGTGEDRWHRIAVGPGTMEVTPDPEARRSVPFDRFVARLADDGDHGFVAADALENRSWWSRAEGDEVQVIGLDTCNHEQGSNGSLGPAQTAWLEAELRRHHRRFLLPDGTWTDGDGPDRLIVLLSHHNSWTMDNATVDEFDPGPRTLGPALVELLLRFPNVVLWANGHSHENKIVVHRGHEPGSGLWEVDTASGIDFGQQGRTFELVDNGDGTTSILVTVLDHASPPAVAHRSDDRWTVSELASIGRELAANDDRWIDPIELLGERGDRNVDLVVRVPARS